MNYLVFNKWVYDYYRTTTLKNGFCSLAIDEYEIEIFKRKHSLEELCFKEINLNPWSRLLNHHNYDGKEIPTYFGLIAIQCLAASHMENSKMENSEIISAANFSNRFCNLTGIERNELNAFYSDPFEGQPIQEVLWYRARNYLRENLGFHLSIPNNIKGTGRYIQFPKSQVVLNKEDLKEIADKVLLRLNLQEVMPESKFNSLFYEKFVIQTFYRKNNKSKHEGVTQDIFFKQVFNYYNSGEWDSVIDKKKISGRRRKTAYVLEFGLEETIHFYNGMDEIHQPYEIFKGGEVHIFEKIAGSVEFEQSCLFSLNTELILVSSSPLSVESDINHNHSGLNIFRCLFNNKEDIPDFLKNRLRNTKDEVPVYLKGIRLGHTWNYIQNFGPEIIGENYSILYTDFNNQKQQVIVENYDSLNCKVGLYKVGIPGFTSLRFIVLDQKEITSIDKSDSGLRLDSFTNSTKGILLKGLELFRHSSAHVNKKAKINDWVKANTKQDFSFTNNLLKSIKYQYYD